MRIDIGNSNVEIQLVYDYALFDETRDPSSEEYIKHIIRVSGNTPKDIVDNINQRLKQLNEPRLKKNIKDAIKKDVIAQTNILIYQIAVERTLMGINKDGAVALY